MTRFLARYFRSGLMLLWTGLQFCYAQPGISIGDDLHFDHITTLEGLSQSTVKCILQDSQGFMWFGTFDGLNKYDGYEFIVYKSQSDDSTSIQGNDIYAVYEDHAGLIWVGTIRGLSVYNRKTDRFINDFIHDSGNPSLNQTNIYVILEDHLGNVWLGTHSSGLAVVNQEGKILHWYRSGPEKRNSISSDKIRALYEDSRGNVWAGTSDQGLNCYRRDQGEFIQYNPDKNRPGAFPGRDVTTITEDSESRLWFACFDEGLASLSPEHIDAPYFEHYKNQPGNPASLSTNYIRSLLADKNGGLWIAAGNNGLDFFDTDSAGFKHLAQDPNDPNGLNNNAIYTFYQDGLGDLWIGTYAGGLNVIHRTKQTFKSCQSIPGESNSLSNNSVWGFDEDSRGNLWIATDGGGLNRLDRKSRKFTHFNTGNSRISSNAVLSVCVDRKDRVWTGTWTGGMNLYEPSTGRFKQFLPENGFPAKSVFDIFEDHRGMLWIASVEAGLIRFNPDSETWSVMNTENSEILYDHIQCIKEDHLGNLYIGTIFGLSVYSNDGVFTSYVSDENDSGSISYGFITCIHEDRKGRIWVATMDGLNEFNPETGKFKAFFEKDGLPNNAIQSICEDLDGNLWISTNHGLSRFNAENQSFKNYTIADGIQGNEFIRNSSYLTRSGDLFFGGVNGFTRFNPEHIIQNTFCPPVVLTHFLLFNKPVPIGTDKSPLSRHISQTDTILLNYSQSVITLGFSALNYVSPLKNQYAYKLEGFETDWNYAGDQRSVTYTNLNPGKYTFHVIGSNNDGVWNEEGAKLLILIQPPFWRTLWFRFVMAAVLGILLFAGYRTRISQYSKYNRELERHVEERTHQLKEMNKELEAFNYSVSHDLRAPLRSMDGFSKALIEDFGTQMPDQVKDYLHRIMAASQKMSQLIDGLLKLSRLSRSEMIFRTVNLSELARTLCQECKESDPERAVMCIIQDGLTTFGDLTLIRSMLRNLFENAWKFTREKQDVRIEFGRSEIDGRAVYFVRDNGIGLDMKYSDRLFEVFQRQHPDYEGMGIGLATVKRIVHRHGGTVWVEGEAGAGATFYFTLGAGLYPEGKGKEKDIRSLA